MENYFQDVAKSEICALCLDFRERKFIIADQLGTVSVHNYLTGVLMKSNEDTVNSMPNGISQSREVSCMIYCKIDKVIMTAGWDKVIRAYDELHPESVELLRCIECAHDNDINAMAHSRALSLIATGDENGALIL